VIAKRRKNKNGTLISESAIKESPSVPKYEWGYVIQYSIVCLPYTLHFAVQAVSGLSAPHPVSRSRL
jgi:hypothetical protein